MFFEGRFFGMFFGGMFFKRVVIGQYTTPEEGLHGKGQGVQSVRIEEIRVLN
jgi:hypothetical protein